MSDHPTLTLTAKHINGFHVNMNIGLYAFRPAAENDAITEIMSAAAAGIRMRGFSATLTRTDPATTEIR